MSLKCPKFKQTIKASKYKLNYWFGSYLEKIPTFNMKSTSLQSGWFNHSKFHQGLRYLCGQTGRHTNYFSDIDSHSLPR